MLMHRIVADFSFLFLIDNKVADFQIWDNALTDDQLLKVKKNHMKRKKCKQITFLDSNHLAR